jgi:hypothetical protein
MVKIKKTIWSVLLGLMLLFVLILFVWVVSQTYFIAISESLIDWTTHLGLKLTIVILRVFSLLVLVLLLLLFALNTIKEKTFFVRKNSILLFCSVFPCLLYFLFENNLHILNNDYSICINIENLIGVFVLLFLGFIYRKAVLLSEENDLTI